MSVPTPSLRPAAFILGAPRSGTTLLRVMLAGHPRLWSPPEMILAPFATMAERVNHTNRRFWEKGGLRRGLMDLEGLDVEAARAREAALEDKTIPEVYALLQSRLGDRMLVDKCPHLAVMPEAMARLESWFPGPRYLWILRHPGSVLRSLENMPMAEVMLDGYGGDAREAWAACNRNIRDFLATIPRERWAIVRYEDLVTDPRPVMERACAALGVPFHEAVLDPYEGDRMREGPKGARAIGDPNMAARGKIDPSLATRWLDGFDPRIASAETRALAKELGYDLDAIPLPPIAKVGEALAALWSTASEIEAAMWMPADVDAIEGRRFLLRIVMAAIDLYTEQSDVDQPTFHHAEGPSRKMFADCPDADYMRAPIRLGDGRRYTLRGRIPATTVYAGVVLYGKGGRVGRFLRDTDLRPDADGRFALAISTERPPAGDDPWLQADGDENAVMVRQYFTDRGRQAPVELSLTLDGPVPPARPLDPADFAKRIELSTRMVKSVVKRTTDAHKMASVGALNRFIEIGGEQLFPTPDNTYRVAWYRFGPSQVMFVRGRVPKARYFSLTLYNAWMESLDYQRHRVCLNSEQMKLDDDGTFEVCLAHRDPGHPNWLDVADHGAGYLLARALLAEEPVPEPTIEVLYEHEWETRKRQRSR